MTTGTTSTTVTLGDWTVVADASGFPTVVTGNDVKIYVNNSGPVFEGEAWSDVDLMDPIPAGATLTDLTFSESVQVTGARDNVGIPINPAIQFHDKAQYLGHTFITGYGRFAAGGVGDLPNDNAVHALDYENAAYVIASGGAGVDDIDAFAAALSNPSTPVIARALGPGQGATGAGITYFAPLTLTFHWDLAVTGQENFEETPPLRLTNRDDMWASARSLTRSGRSRQGGARITGYL